jgi:hypothetical protein
MFDLRLLAALTLIFAAFAPVAGLADSPPDMPLPPCTYVGGVFYGACPAESDVVSGTGAGRFVAGATLAIRTNPSIPVCDSMSTYTYIWTPSNCYSAVSAPRVVTCAVIDLTDNEKFREMPCAQALYRSTQGVPSPLFTTIRPAPGYNNRTACGDTPSYSVYAQGGPATQIPSVWRTRGPQALDCNMTFAATRRPDGLYGPTWAKVEVQINVGETGKGLPGRSEWEQFYIPIDGDMRTTADVEVSGSGSVTTSDWDNGRVFATYQVTLTNRSSTRMENVKLTAALPNFVMAQSVSTSQCKLPIEQQGIELNPTRPMPNGQSIECEWASMGANSTITANFVVRIVNATDFAALQAGATFQDSRAKPGVELIATASNDQNSRNNSTLVKIDIPFRNGSFDETRQAMQPLGIYFNYRTSMRGAGCNEFKDEINDRLDAIRTEHPEVFTNLSFGNITSGDYKIPLTGASAGHVGVVVYMKGTDYRKTGIIINGTPITSPLNLHSEIGSSGSGGVFGLIGSTSDHGMYLRTQADKFPGFPQQEKDRGFEGRYGNNGQEFTYGGGIYAPDVNDAPMACPLAPDAAIVHTESPVDIIVTNSRGQRVETQGGQLITQGFDKNIRSMAFPHGDGTFEWILVLPAEDYNVQLRGTGAGPYKLTLTTFDQNGTARDVVTNGTTAPGQVNDYTLDAPDVTTPPPPPTTATPAPTPAANTESGGGGGSIDVLLLAALSLIVLSRLIAARRRRKVIR